MILYQSVRELLFNVVKHAETARSLDHAEAKPGEGGRPSPSPMVDAGSIRRPFWNGSRSPRTIQGSLTCKMRVEAIGGHLSLLSGEGQGTTVTITVPVETTAPSARSIAAEHLHQSRTRAISPTATRVARR